MHQFKYLKFTLIEDPSVKNITFEITPLHGDSDIYVSRVDEFPNKDVFEKKSQRIGSLVDYVTFNLRDVVN